jgi:hypothetical protein
MEKADRYLDVLNELRLIVLCECTGAECDLEDKPDDKHFHQVILDPAQFKKVSDILFTGGPTTRPGFEEGEIQVSDRCISYIPFEGMSSHT